MLNTLLVVYGSMPSPFNMQGPLVEKIYFSWKHGERLTVLISTKHSMDKVGLDTGKMLCAVNR